MQQNKTTVVQSPLMTLGQEMRWVYSAMLVNPHEAANLRNVPDAWCRWSGRNRDRGGLKLRLIGTRWERFVRKDADKLLADHTRHRDSCLIFHDNLWWVFSFHKSGSVLVTVFCVLVCDVTQLIVASDTVNWVSTVTPPQALLYAMMQP